MSAEPVAVELPAPPPVTIVEVIYPPELGRIGLRGSHAPLSWEATYYPEVQRGHRHLFRIPLPPGEVLELKLVRNEDEWAGGRNYAVHAGDHLRLEPHFEATGCTLEAPTTLEIDGEQIRYQVLLPPSYGEQSHKRYPVLYAQDGQSLWSTSQDPYGVWHLDSVVNQLIELGAMDEVIIVGIEASDKRIERLSPVPDPKHGGGNGPGFLAVIVDALRPGINQKYRTRTGREHTAIMGSSMGGLFSFFAAWNRPDVFGKAACLSSSFWWAERWAIRMVQQSETPDPRPVLYIDSGAAVNALERDVNVRDGFQHTGAMLRALARHAYAPGSDLHRLVFTGHTHDAASWSARAAVPLQLLFPPRAPIPADWVAATAHEEGE